MLLRRREQFTDSVHIRALLSLPGWLAVASAAWGLRSRLAEPPQASEEALLDGLTGSNMCPDDWSHSSIPLHHGWLERTTTNNSFQSLQCNSFSISLPKLPKNEQVISSTCTPTSQSVNSTLTGWFFSFPSFTKQMDSWLTE